jgi:hypothetical protein
VTIAAYDIAGVEIAILINNLGGELGLTIVSEHHVGTSHKQLSW